MRDKSKFDKFLIGRNIIKTAEGEFEFEFKEDDTKEEVRSLIQNEFEHFMDRLAGEGKEPTIEELKKSELYSTFKSNVNKLIEKAIEKKIISEDDKKALMTEYGIKAKIGAKVCGKMKLTKKEIDEIAQTIFDQTSDIVSDELNQYELSDSKEDDDIQDDSYEAANAVWNALVKKIKKEEKIESTIDKDKLKVDGKYDMIYMIQMLEVMKDKGYDKEKAKEILMDSGVDEETATKQTDLMFKEKEPSKAAAKIKFKNEALVQTESGVRDSIPEGAEVEVIEEKDGGVTFEFEGTKYRLSNDKMERYTNYKVKASEDEDKEKIKKIKDFVKGNKKIFSGKFIEAKIRKDEDEPDTYVFYVAKKGKYFMGDNEEMEDLIDNIFNKNRSKIKKLITDEPVGEALSGFDINIENYKDFEKMEKNVSGVKDALKEIDDAIGEAAKEKGLKAGKVPENWVNLGFSGGGSEMEEFFYNPDKKVIMKYTKDGEEEIPLDKIKDQEGFVRDALIEEGIIEGAEKIIVLEVRDLDTDEYSSDPKEIKRALLSDEEAQFKVRKGKDIDMPLLTDLAGKIVYVGDEEIKVKASEIEGAEKKKISKSIIKKLESFGNKFDRVSGGDFDKTINSFDKEIEKIKDGKFDKKSLLKVIDEMSGNIAEKKSWNDDMEGGHKAIYDKCDAFEDDISDMEEFVEGIEASSIKAESKLIMEGIDAGGGATIDLYYDPDKDEIIENKTSADGKLTTFTTTLEEFEPENYGEAGEEFLEKVDAMKSESSMDAEDIIKKELELLEAAEKELFQKDWIIYNLEKGNILCMTIMGKDKDWKLKSWINLENNVSVDMDRILDFGYDSMLKAAKQKEDKYTYAISDYSFDPEILKAYFLKLLGEDKFAGRYKVDIEIDKDEFEKQIASIIGKPDIQGSDDFKKNIKALEALMAATGADERLADEDKQYEDQLAKGAEVESEHKDTIALIKKKLDETGKLPSDHEIYESIAKDHIIELPDYYDKLAKMESGNIESDDKPPKEPEKDIFDLTEGVQLGDGLTLYKDVEKDEVYVNDKEGKELFRAPNVLKDDMVKIIEFMRIVLKMDEEEPEKGKKPDKPIAKQPGEKEKPEEPLLPEQETDDATKEELAKMKEEIDKKKKKVKEIVEKVNNTNQLNVSKEEIKAQIRAGERNPIFAKRRAIEEKNKKLTLTLYEMDDKAMHIIESALIKNEKSDELNNLLNL